jgi:CDP-6-deoxy-D-xylo-4-hexulose-3-dehydrase
MIQAVNAVLEGVWTSDWRTRDFERMLATYVGTHYALATNSGSSANLLAVLAASDLFEKDRVLYPEVITMAAGFPTTVFPIMQAGMLPHFIDITLPHYGPNMVQLEEAINSNTVGIILAHTLGNPYDASEIARIAKEHDIFLIEDCCDALGATIHGQKVGSYGIAGTESFFPAHIITTGEGGAVVTSSALMKRLIETYRDWGRDCWCDPGHDATCNNRYGQQFGELPFGYDHKYVYTLMGYNLKMTDIQAAIGVAQMSQIGWFVDKRKENFNFLLSGLSYLEEFFILPEEFPDSSPAWFGFPLTIRDGAPFTRAQMIDYLDKARIDSRLLFAGNIVRQPVMAEQVYTSEDLTMSDKVMNDTFWIGVHPSLTQEMLDYMLETFEEFTKEL